ncbi:MAG: hypothetical protein J6M34_01505 [Clostridia bacterium]|nr:hypothetical protein [Clostridia bacterium]
MKKLIAFLLIAIMALALVACGEGDDAPSTENQPNTKQTVSSSETDKSEEKTDVSESTETSDESVKTEETVNSDTENKEPTLDDIFKGYPEALHALGMFNSVENLDSLRIFNWTMGHVKPIRENRDLDKQIFAYTYASKDLNNIAYKYLGHRWAFETVNGEGASGDAGYSYNQTDDTVTVTYYGAFGDIGPEIAYVGYTEKDSTHFTVNYTKTYPGDAPEAYFLEVEFADGSYLVRAQKKAEDNLTPPTPDKDDNNETEDKTPSAEEIGSMLHEVSHLSQYLIVHYENGPKLNAKQILTYFINNICSDLEVSVGDKVPAETVYEYVKKSFDFDEAMKTLLKACELYNEADDTFTIWGEYYSNSVYTTCVYAFEDLGNNDYVLYVKYAEWNSDFNVMEFSNFSDWKATVTYREDMEPKDFCFLWHSFEKIDEIPVTATLTGINYFE